MVMTAHDSQPIKNLVNEKRKTCSHSKPFEQPAAFTQKASPVFALGKEGASGIRA
jgi:hypothetical protein